MCGIAGVGFIGEEAYSPSHKISTMRQKAMEVMRELLILTSNRGTDATGIWHTKVDSRINPTACSTHMFKAPLSAIQFLKLDKVEKCLERQFDSGKTLFVVGHTRATTCGSEANNFNNHPFVCGKMLGVHNGIISNHRKIISDESLPIKGECDSEAIFSLLNKESKEGDPKDIRESLYAALVKLNGWAALAFMHLSKSNVLYLFKDKSTPLYVKFFYDSKMVIFASSEHSIDEAVSKVDKGANKSSGRLLPFLGNQLLQIDFLNTQMSLEIARFDVSSDNIHLDHKCPHTA